MKVPIFSLLEASEGPARPPQPSEGTALVAFQGPSVHRFGYVQILASMGFLGAEPSSNAKAQQYL